MEIGEKLTELTVQYLPKILVAVAILVIGFWTIKGILRLMGNAMRKRKVDVSLHTFVKSVTSIVLKILVIFTAASSLDIPMTTFIAILSSAAIAVGLALKDSLSNFAGGMLILFFRPFSVGDFIQAEGYSGSVKEIGILFSTINTYDNIKVMIPNGQLANAKITNYSAEDTRLYNLACRVRYDADIPLIKDLLMKIAMEHPLVLREPAPFVGLREYTESSINLTFRVWAKRTDYWPLLYDINEKVKTVFDENNIKIPHAQRDIHIYNGSDNLTLNE